MSPPGLVRVVPATALQSPLKAFVRPTNGGWFDPDWKFWVPGSYYRTVGWHRWTGVDDEGQSVSFMTKAEHPVLCVAVEKRSYCVPYDPDVAGLFATLRTLHPGDRRKATIKGFAGTDAIKGFERIDNPMEILAIAADTGLAL